MIRIEPRQATSPALKYGVPVLSSLIALALAAIPLALAGANVGNAYVEMFTGVFGSVFAFSEMLTRATPLIFTGLAAASSSRGEFHPSALTEPDLRLSPHPAPTLQPPVEYRVATGQKGWGPVARYVPANAWTPAPGV